MSDADQNNRLQAGRAKLVRDHLGQFGDVIAKTTRAKLAEIRQVFTKLGWFDPRDFGKGLARNGLNFVVFQPGEAAKINGEPINGFAWDFWRPRSSQQRNG